MRNIRNISLILVLIFIFSATACEKSNVKEGSASKQPTTTTLSNNSINNANSTSSDSATTETPIDTTSSAEVSAAKETSTFTETPMLFSQQYDNVKGLVGKSIKCETLEHNPDLWNWVADNATELSDGWFDRSRGLILSKDLSGRRGMFICNVRIETFHPKDKVFYLPKELSNNIRIFSFEDWINQSTNGYAMNNEYPTYLQKWIKTTPKNSKIMMVDDEKNMIIVAGFEGQELMFYKSVQIPMDIELSDYTVEMAYENRAIISSKLNNDILIINAETLQLIERKEMQNWETLCGYNDKLYLNKESKERNYCLYQVDRSVNILRVYDVKANKVLKKYDLSKLPVKGNFINVFSDREGWLVLEYKEEKSVQPIKLYFYNVSTGQLMKLDKETIERLNEVKQINNMFFFYELFQDEGEILIIAITVYDRSRKEEVGIAMAHEYPYKEINLIPIKTDIKGFSVIQ